MDEEGKERVKRAGEEWNMRWQKWEKAEMGALEGDKIEGEKEKEAGEEEDKIDEENVEKWREKETGRKWKRRWFR